MNFIRKLFLASLFGLLFTVSLALAAVNINTANQSELEQLPGVGSKQAQQIMAARPFKSVDDLKNVKGIGDKKFARLSPLVTVSGDTTASASANGMAAGAGAMANRMENSANNAANSMGNTASNTVSSMHSRMMHKERALAPGEKININTASKEDLVRLPGIGDKKADSIIASRPFKAPEEVMKVKGIKAGIYAKIKDHITTG